MVHCISSCASQSKGLAKEVCLKFPMNRGIPKGLPIGSCYPCHVSERITILNLITKAEKHEKPTLTNLKATLLALRRYALSNKIYTLSMPKLGCGLDGLTWTDVQNMVITLFIDTKIKINVYTNLEKNANE